MKELEKYTYAYEYKHKILYQDIFEGMSMKFSEGKRTNTPIPIKEIEYHPFIKGQFSEYTIGDGLEAFIGSPIKIIGPNYQYMNMEEFIHLILDSFEIDYDRFMVRSTTAFDKLIINHVCEDIEAWNRPCRRFDENPIDRYYAGDDLDKWHKGRITIPLYEYGSMNYFTLSVTLDHFINRTNYELLSDWTREKLLKIYKSFLPANFFKHKLSDLEKERIAMRFFNKSIKQKEESNKYYSKLKSKSLVA